MRKGQNRIIEPALLKRTPLTSPLMSIWETSFGTIPNGTPNRAMSIRRQSTCAPTYRLGFTSVSAVRQKDATDEVRWKLAQICFNQPDSDCSEKALSQIKSPDYSARVKRLRAR